MLGRVRCPATHIASDGYGDYFWQSYEENQVTENSPYDPLYQSSRPRFPVCMEKLIFGQVSTIEVLNVKVGYPY